MNNIKRAVGFVEILKFTCFSGLSRPKSDGNGNLQDSNPEEDIDLEPMIINRGPFFDKSASKNVTALVDKTSYLNCKVRNLGNRTVSKKKRTTLIFTS